MMVTATGLQWALFTESFCNQLVFHNHDWHYVDINIYSLLNALYAISAVLISFGAVIGKISPLQLLSMTIIELVLHSVNFQMLMLGALKLTGEINSHSFLNTSLTNMEYGTNPVRTSLTTKKTVTAPSYFLQQGLLSST